MIIIIAFIHMVLFAAAINGIGKLLRKRILQIGEELNLYDWVFGFAAVALVTAIVNFFIPINRLFQIGFVFFGIVVLLSHYEIKSLFKNRKIFFVKVSVDIIILVLVVYWAAGPILEGLHPDTGSYHYPLLDKIRHSALPLGIANINHRFGFNTWWSLLGSITNPLFTSANYQLFLVNGLLIFFFTRTVWLKIWNMFSDNSFHLTSSWILIFSLVIQMIRRPILWPTLSNDLPVAVFTILIFHLLVRYQEETSSRIRSEIFFISLLTCILTITIKLSAGILIIPLLWMFVLLIRQGPPVKIVIPVIIVTLPFVLTYIFRGIWLSGMPLFPSGFLAIESLPWAVPVETAEKATEAIRGWARHPGRFSESFLELAWIPSWLKRNAGSLIKITILTVLSILAFFITWIRSKKNPFTQIKPALFTAFLGILYWFITAPAMRFGEPYLYAVPILLASAAVSKFMSTIYLRYRRIIALGLVLILVCGFLTTYSLWTKDRSQKPDKYFYYEIAKNE